MGLTEGQETRMVLLQLPNTSVPNVQVGTLEKWPPSISVDTRNYHEPHASQGSTWSHVADVQRRPCWHTGSLWPNVSVLLLDPHFFIFFPGKWKAILKINCYMFKLIYSSYIKFMSQTKCHFLLCQDCLWSMFQLRKTRPILKFFNCFKAVVH